MKKYKRGKDTNSKSWLCVLSLTHKLAMMSLRIACSSVIPIERNNNY